MHLSLKGSMDRQPLTDRLGDRLLAEYGGAAAAYSLRALNGNGDSVVRVRRASDNDEEDFTAEQIELGEMVNWVNSQIVPPLDIGVLTPEGRIPVPEGGTSIGIPAAAYSLRNLSTTYTGNVVDVRRSSGGTESFTAAEVADGTLTDWVNEDVLKYSSDFSSNLDGFIVDAGDAAIAGQTFEGESDVVKHTPSVSLSGSHRIRRLTTVPLSSIVSLKVLAYIPSSNTVANGVQIRNAAGDLISGTTTTDEWIEVEATGTSGSEGASSTFSIHATSGGDRNFAGNGTDVIYYKNVSVTVTSADGFVSQWYDQSGNDNHATQGTDAKQPKIVDGGSLVSGGIEFDGVDDLLRNSNNLGTTSNFFISCVATLPDSIANQTILSNGTGFLSSGDSWFLKRRSGLDNALAFQDSSPRALGSSAISETQGIFTAESNGTNLKIYANGSEQDSVSTYTAVLNGTTIGARLDEVSHLTGQINEVIIYATDQSANRTAIEANIGETYGITGIPAYDNTVDGFVETWYDQSGNGNDATQLTANDQPRIVISGNLVTSSNGLPAIRVNALAESFDLDSNIALGNFSLFYTVEHTAFGSAVSWLSNNSGSTYMRYTPIAYNVDTGAIDNGYINLDATLATATNYLISAIRGSGIIELSVSGSVQSNTDSNSGTLSVQKMFQRGSNETQGLNGYAQELIIYPTDKTANRVAIETNINDHYNIY
jgi:hypothetical protein